jgi:uncharacterized protein (DUF433 family)
MMTVAELETYLLALSTSEQRHIIQLLTQNLGDNPAGIIKDPNICGGEAHIANTQIAVWELVNAQRLGYSDSDILQSYPQLSAIDLVNAWDYAETWADEIAQTLQAVEQ